MPRALSRDAPQGNALPAKVIAKKTRQSNEWYQMTYQRRVTSMTRLRQALVAFEHAETLHLSAQRKLKGQQRWAEASVFWDGPERRIEATLQASAKEVIVSFSLYSEAGLVVFAVDQHLLTKARRYVADDRGEAPRLPGRFADVQARIPLED